MLLVAIGKFFEKGLRMGTGQCNVKRYKQRASTILRARASSFRGPGRSDPREAGTPPVAGIDSRRPHRDASV
jgi:hypothetical protein